MKPLYSGPIIDPHHHLWDLSLRKHPWLKAQKSDQQGPLNRDYGIDDYLKDTEGQNLVASVHVEAGWSDAYPLEETAWLDSLEHKSGVAHRYVVRVPLDHATAFAQLEQEAANPPVVGVRDIVSWHPDPQKSFARRNNLMSDDKWREGIRHAHALGLSIDLMLFPWQIAEAIHLIQDHPDIQFIVNHCGSPIDRSVEGLSLWQEGIVALSRCPNVAIKISNPVAYDPNWTVHSLSMVINHCIASFGAERAMFASDFPVANLQAEFGALYDAFRLIVSGLSEDEQHALFFSTANRVYRMNFEH